MEEEPAEMSKEEEVAFAKAAEHSAYQKIFYNSIYGMSSININKMAIHEAKG